jgi:hypothetical protein
MNRIYHPYHLWEDWKFGMWRYTSEIEKAEYLQRAIEFTGDAELYGSYMLKVLAQWPYACEHNLSNRAINRQAWIGHAACCLAINCPEDITRLAWHQLTQKQQDDANAKADFAIQTWENRQCQSAPLESVS